jgi:hypothetical protein
MLLQKKEYLRDDDKKLMFNVWAKQEPKLNNSDYKYWDFAKIYISGKLASSGSIIRSRAKLQEEFPELRGENYKGRQQHQENVKEQLNEPEFYPGGTP